MLTGFGFSLVGVIMSLVCRGGGTFLRGVSGLSTRSKTREKYVCKINEGESTHLSQNQRNSSVN